MLLLGVPAGCAERQEEREQAVAPVPRTDRAIAEALRDELRHDPYIPATALDLSVRDGVVTLEGEVGSLLVADRARRIASTVRGVRAIVDRLVIAPAAEREDAEMRADVRDALRLDTAVDHDAIRVEVEDGRVRLTGEVASHAEADLAVHAASGVLGVRAVDARLEVRHAGDRTDRNLREEIEGRLARDVRVQDPTIRVEVSGGEVVLEGTVGSLAEKRQAIADAQVVGVETIDATGLVVSPFGQDPDLRAEPAEVPDPALLSAVTDALVYDPRVPIEGISLTVHDGVVVLSGSVDSVRAKHAAVSDAGNTVGAREVVDRLRVEPTAATADRRLHERLTRAFARDAVLAEVPVEIEVEDGVAELRGVVQAPAEAERAVEVAASVPGVVEIRPSLTVGDPASPVVWQPYVTEWAWLETQPPEGPPATSDGAIEAAIRRELAWSPYAGEDVHVQVDDGVATLVGTVRDRTAHAVATENAFEGGAIWVDNRLQIGPAP